MLASRTRARVRLGLWSTAVTRVWESSSANVIGTRWGRPSDPTVAKRATGEVAKRRIASAEGRSGVASPGMRVPITLSLHIPNFNYPGVEPDQVFEQVAAIAATAESSGFS